MGKLDDAAFVGAIAPMAAIPVGLAYKADKIQQERKKEREDKEMSKEEEIKRKQEPSGGGGSEGPARNKAMKKGGKVRGHGCEQRGKTKGRFV
jgi:hypothetical protein